MHDPTLQRAMEDMEQNRLPQAIASLRLRVRLKPRDAAAHTLLGSALQRAGEFEQATRFSFQGRLTDMSFLRSVLLDGPGLSGLFYLTHRTLLRHWPSTKTVRRFPTAFPIFSV